MSLLHLLLLYYGNYLSRQLKNHLVVFKGRVCLYIFLSLSIFFFIIIFFVSRLYHFNVLYLELPLKTTYRLHLMLNTAAWLLKDLFAAGLMQTQLSAYNSRCVFKVLLQVFRVSQSLFYSDLNFETSKSWNL